MSFNVPALWRYTKFFSFAYPLSTVASVHGTRSVQVDLRKYLTGDSEFLSRIIIHIHGNVVVAGAGVGVATGLDNPGNALVSANLATSPQFVSAVPVNAVSSRGLHADGILNAGQIGQDDPQAWGGSTVISDAVGTKAVDLFTALNFKRSPGVVRNGVEYSFPLPKYTSAILQMVFGGRDQFFTGGTNTWDLSGLVVDLYADLDGALQPKFIHAQEIFENNYPVLASNKDLKIDNLAAGWEYTDLVFITEDANAPVDGILNNVAIMSGSQTWLPKGEANAQSFRFAWAQRNNRVISNLPLRSSTPGFYPIPLRDRMFTRGFDARYGQLQISLDVTSLSATSNVRLVGRRMIPGGIYHDKSK
jgi:hypothetical protein